MHIYCVEIITGWQDLWSHSATFFCRSRSISRSFSHSFSLTLSLSLSLSLSLFFSRSLSLSVYLSLALSPFLALSGSSLSLYFSLSLSISVCLSLSRSLCLKYASVAGARMQVNAHGITRKIKGFNSMANVVSAKFNAQVPPAPMQGWRNVPWYVIINVFFGHI